MGLCDYTGFGSSITSFGCEATTGNLSQADVDALQAQAESDVRQASAGRQPAVVQTLVDQVKGEINSVLQTFALPGETGQNVGALPSQSAVRVPGTGNITLDKLKEILPQLPDLTNIKYWIIGIAIIVGAVYALPFVAPPVKRAIGSVR